MNTKEKGDLSEARVIAKLTEYDVDVFLPTNENTRSDMIVSSEKLEKIQVKTGRINDGSVIFNCSKINSNMNSATRTDYKGEIDAFIIHCPDNNGYYYVNIEDAGKTEMRLRVDESMGDNGRVKWAKDYTLSDVYEKLEF